MEFTRRGLFGLLGGALLAKIIGPKPIAEPTAASWEAAKRLPAYRTSASYVPLETACSRVLEIVNQEIKWLHLRQEYENREVRFGDVYLWRKARLLRAESFQCYESCDLMESYHRATYGSHVGVDLPWDDCEDEAPFGFVDASFIQPAGLQMAERLIDTVRRHGGGEILVCGRSEIPADVDRCVLARDSASGLSVRGIELGRSPACYFPGRGLPRVRLDMTFGLG